jgi:hypothetical protein
MEILVDGIWAHSQQHCKRLGISYNTVCGHVHQYKHLGLTHEQAIANAVYAKNKKVGSWWQMAKAHNMNPHTFCTRMKRWKGDLKRSIETPVRVWSRKCQNV